jgi:Tol biopolymer transport system component
MSMIKTFLTGVVTGLLLLAQLAPGQAAASKDPLPLQTERTFSLTTDEGTWISLDVSPDGKQVIFDLLGHIYSMPIDGGEAKAITNSLSFDSQPRYSPDGAHIVFTSDRSGDDNVWVMKADGTNPIPISQEETALFTSPSWTSDGASILVSKKKPHHYSGAFELWQYSLNGGSGIQVIKSKGAEKTPQSGWHNALGVTSGPDVRYIYYARRFGTWASEKLPSWQVARRDLNTGEEEVITAAQGSAFRPHLSPDGTKLVYAVRYDSNTGLRIRDLATLEDKWLKYPVQHDDQEGSASSRDLLPDYAFLPDGKDIVLSYGGKIHRLNIESGQDRLIPFSAKITRGLGPHLNFAHRVETGPIEARLIQGAVASPDGKRIAFSALRHLYVMDLGPGAIPKRLTTATLGEFQPAWSADGAWIAYASWENEEGALWKIHSDGSGAPQRLTTANARFSQPAWNPDSSRLVALRTSPYQAKTQFDQWGHDMDIADLIWIPSAGGTPTTVSSAIGFSGFHFTQDNDRIYFTFKNSSGPLAADYLLQSERSDGTDRRTHFTLKGKDIWGAEISPSVRIYLTPDKRTALALLRGQVYLLDTPFPGGEPVTIDVSAPSLGVARLTDVGADEVGWTDAGKTITWSLGASFFRLPLQAAGLNSSENRTATPVAHVRESKSTAWPKGLNPLETRVKVEAARDTPHGTVILRGARVITMRGDEVLNAADIVVKDNRIAYVGAHASASDAAGAQVIDVQGSTIVPGFIDTHAHWTQIRRGVLDTQNWDFLATLAYGVTTGRDPQTFSNDTFAYQDLADTGDILGPRAYSTGPGIFFVNDFQSVDEAADVISRYKNYYRTQTIKSYVVGNRRQREFVVEASKRLQMMPTTEGFADMTLDLTHVIDGFGGAEHQFPIFPIYKDVVELVAQSGVFYTPTYIIDYGGPSSESYYLENTDVYNDPKIRRFFPHDYLNSRTSRMMWYRKDEYVFAQLAASAAAIVKAGGKVCVGGHGEMQGLSFHWELWSLHEGGMTNLQALRAATLTGAEAIGFAQDLGSIEVGKLADLVVLRKNPLDDIHNSTATKFVMKNGRLFDGDSLDEVWPNKKPLGKFWWSDDHP